MAEVSPCAHALDSDSPFIPMPKWQGSPGSGWDDQANGGTSYLQQEGFHPLKDW
jgi:hypothetical protein